MNPKLKDVMGVAIVIAVLLFSYSYYRYVNAYGIFNVRTFYVSAEGKAVAVPDVARFSYTVLTEGGLDVSKVQDENSTKAKAIVDYLKGEGVDAKDITTSSYYVDPRYTYFECKGGVCPPSKITGYTASSSVTVKVRDMDKAGELLQGVVTKGATNVSGPEFTIDDPSKVEQLARLDAIKKAEEKAKTLSKAAGIRLGRVVNISEYNASPYYEGGKGGATMEAVSDSAVKVAPVIEPGSQEVVMTVNLEYRIR